MRRIVLLIHRGDFQRYDEPFELFTEGYKAKIPLGDLQIKERDGVCLGLKPFDQMLLFFLYFIIR
jgi:hypothetical protein